MHIKGRTAALLAAVAFSLAACGTTTVTVPPHTVTSGHGNFEASNSHGCGVERWAVKTGTDPAVSQVNTKPQDTTIQALTALPVPPGFGQDASRLAGTAEMQVYRLSHVTLTGYKMEADSDYHLILSDGSTTMISEIPSPACVGASSPWIQQITAARAAFDAKFPQVGGFFQQANVVVTITGVGFFDTIHGQTGVAPNGIELHPVLDIQFGS